MNTRELCQMPALILSQLRWLDRVVSGQVGSVNFQTQ